MKSKRLEIDKVASFLRDGMMCQDYLTIQKDWKADMENGVQGQAT
jgi:hypothetical protein